MRIKRDLDILFNPRSIAFIGASQNPAKWGFIIPLNILKGQFKGELYPVNPRLESFSEFLLSIGGAFRFRRLGDHHDAGQDRSFVNRRVRCKGYPLRDRRELQFQ